MPNFYFNCVAFTALELAGFGFPVFPCHKEKKSPLIPNGFKGASKDSNIITQWWRKNPDAMIGMPTGAISGIVVVDLDRHGSADGLVEWDKLTQKYGAVNTRTVSTQSGGLHLYFQQPRGIDLNNTTGKLASGIDTRATGGYVITAGSYGAKGAYRVLNDIPPAPLPVWLLSLWLGKTSAKSLPPEVGKGVPEGSRNDSAFKLACKLRDAGEDRASALQQVLDFANTCQPPLPQHEVPAVVDSAFAKPVQHVKKELKVFDVNGWIPCAEMEPQPILTDFLDLGDKLTIVAPSKCRKSFFTLQLAFSVAEGKELFGGFGTEKRRVLLIQPEIREGHFHRRVRRMAHSMDFAPEPGALTVINARGSIPDIEDIIRYAKECEAELIILDPIYKFFKGSENDQRDMAEFLAGIDRIAEETGAGICLVHHDKKGIAGDRNTVDRGSGSGVLARDYDACIALTPHSADKEALVIDFICRNYPPRPQMVARWEGYGFKLDNDLTAMPETSYTHKKALRQGPAFDALVDQALKLLPEPTLICSYRLRLKDKLSISENKAKGLVDFLEVNNHVTIDQQNIKGGGKMVSRVQEGSKVAKVEQLTNLSDLTALS